MENKRKAAFLTLGCKVNSYETIAMEKLFQDRGYELTEFSEKADVYVVNTCTVTNIADRKSRQMLHKAKKNNPDAIVVAAGCYVQAAGEAVQEDMAVDIIIGNNKKSNVVDVVEEYMKSKGISVKDNYNKELFQEKNYEELHVDYAQEKTRAVIKIQDGCNQFCSYCIIPFARGRVRSRELEDILSEVKLLAEKGCHEVVLTGIHLSSYGVDLEPWVSENKKHDFISLAGRPLLKVIEEVSRIEGIERIRLGSLEPRIITEEFVKQISKVKELCPHFHLSLQSGCDATLERMNRRYTTTEFAENVAILRKYYKDPAITTDIIVGFPGETLEELKITKKFLEDIAFAQMHVFKYSVRKGTKAETMENQVTEQIKSKRSDEVLEIERRMRKQYMEQMIGKEQTILLEEMMEVDGKQYMIGHNERYVKLAIEISGASPEELENTFVKAVPSGWLTKDILIVQ